MDFCGNISKMNIYKRKGKFWWPWDLGLPGTYQGLTRKTVKFIRE